MTLTNFPNDPLLDLDPWVGQRSATFRFERIDAVTGDFLGELHPVRGSSVLNHDTTRTIKRQLTMALGTEDSAAVNMVSERVDLFMVFGNGAEYPLGRYMYTDASQQQFTSGTVSQVTLNDEMFRVDQPLLQGIDGTTKTAQYVIRLMLADINDIDLDMAGGSFLCNTAWSAGTNRGKAMEDVALAGDYFSPWFDNNKKLHFIRTFDPAVALPDFDFDTGRQVMRASILASSNLLTAPNRFLVISNNATDPKEPVVATYDIPRTAPNSAANRGFVITQVNNSQARDLTQAAAIARNLGLRQTVFATTVLTTAPDPRHDSYNVIHWQGANWLELAWNMPLVEGGAMSHTIRKAYAP